MLCSGEKYLQTLALGALVIISLYLNISIIDHAKAVRSARLRSTQWLTRKGHAEDSYSYIGRDHPNYLPIEQKQVLVTMEDSVRYSISDPEAEEEWLWTGPIGDHDIRLGKEYRAFAVAMFHELHCMRIMRRALAAGDYKRLHPIQQGHIHHCFVYLRLWTLCAADVTLEPGDFALRNFTTERTGATHTCKDWDSAYEFVNNRWETWSAYRREMGVPDPVE